MTYLESCISCCSENYFFASSLPHSGYLALRTSACDCSWWSAALMSSVSSCRLVLEMVILTLLRDADSMTTSIATCLMRMSGPSAPCLISSDQYQFTHAWSVEHSFNHWCQLLARCVLIDRFHVDLERGGTTYKSLVDMEQEKHTGRPATVRFF